MSEPRRLARGFCLFERVAAAVVRRCGTDDRLASAVARGAASTDRLASAVARRCGTDDRLASAVARRRGIDDRLASAVARGAASVAASHRLLQGLLAAALCLIAAVAAAGSMAAGYAAPGTGRARSAARPPRKTQTVVLIVSDGLRWQEVFTGAEEDLLNDKEGGSWLSAEDLRRRYWRSDPVERRALLFPFLWGTVATHGQLFGNQVLGSVAHVTNGKAFSYPGYNEMSTGYPNDAIDSNEFGPNPNATVFEWLNKSASFRGRVAIYGTWNVYDDIFNKARSGLIMQTGWTPPEKADESPRAALLRELYASTTEFDEEDVPNSFLQVPLLDYVKTGKPRVLFVGYGETDNWAHQGRYDLVLDSAHRFDHFVAQLWNTMQAMPRYRGSTTFIITTDHGRGSGLGEWKEHGVEEKGSENIWIGVIGPDTAPLGERSQVAPVAQAQIAATVAAFVGKDYPAAVPRAAAPIAAVLPAKAP